MGSSNSRAAGNGDPVQRPQQQQQQHQPRFAERHRRRPSRGFRPFIRSLSCGTVFPRSNENEELPAENGGLPVFSEEEICADQVGMSKCIHPCPISSEHLCDGAGPSGESSTGVSSGATMQSSETQRVPDPLPSVISFSSEQLNGNKNPGSCSNSNVPEAAAAQSETMRSGSSTNAETEASVSLDETRQSTHGEGSSQPSSSQINEHSGNLRSSPAVTTPNGGLLRSEDSDSEQLSRYSESSLDVQVSESSHVEAATSSFEDSTGLQGYVSSQEARRNRRRRLWDAIAGGTQRRRSFTPAILLSADIDDLGSTNDRWLLDLSGLLLEAEDDGPSGGRSSGPEETRGRFRSQVWALQRLRRNSDGTGGHARYCSFHADGRCSCEAYVMTEETTHASISRIVLLAEALFEVLDEIHRQSIALSQSTSSSLVCLPAPEAVVDSLPTRDHESREKAENATEEEAQCYICLSEYEEGDKIRTLPCHHEYHMSCVDKWLKEIHRVCPLCRGNVCENQAVVSTSSDASTGI